MFKNVFTVDVNYRMALSAIDMSHKRLTRLMSTITVEFDSEAQECCATVDNNIFQKLLKYVKSEDMQNRIPRIGDHMMICLFNIEMLSDYAGLEHDISIQFIRSIFYSFHNIAKRVEDKSKPTSWVDLVMLIVYANRFYDECYKNIDRFLAANKNTLEISQIKRFYRKITEEHIDDKKEIDFLEYTLGCLTSVSIQVEALSKIKQVDQTKVAVLQVLLKKYHSLLERAGKGDWCLENDGGVIDEVNNSMITAFQVLDELMFSGEDAETK